MTAKEFLKQVSPDDRFGIRADLKAAKIEKHIIDIMERYAALRIHDVIKSVCECDEPIKQMTDKGEYCLRCREQL